MRQEERGWGELAVREEEGKRKENEWISELEEARKVKTVWREEKRKLLDLK